MEKVINGVFCRVVEKEWDVYFDMALTMFEEIVKNNQAGKPSVFIVPVGPTDQYPILAKLINSQRVSLKNVHFFNMDEYLVSPTQWISEDDPMSFHGRMKREFYDRVDEDLIMPESQRHFPEPGHEKEYDELIADLGGVDMCFGGLGINGHVAFNEAAEADDPITADAYAELGTRVLPISRETRAVNAFGYQRFTTKGDANDAVDGAPVRTRGKKVYIALNRPWQSGPLKHVLHGEMVPQWPGSLLRRLPDVRFCMTEDIARGIV